MLLENQCPTILLLLFYLRFWPPLGEALVVITHIDTLSASACVYKLSYG